MPELPEVETVRRGLKTLIIGRMIRSVSVLDSPKSFPNAQADVNEFMIGAEVTAVRRRAKVLLIDLSTQYTLVIHLKMTGQLVYIKKEGLAPPLESEVNPESALHPLKLVRRTRTSSLTDENRFGAGHPTDSLIGELPDRSTRVMIEFTDNSWLYFNDQRKFGWMKLLPSLEVPTISFMKTVGPEPLEADFTVEQFTKRFARRARTNIKAALLDQTVVAGVGNIYADESLWGAKISPMRKVADIAPQEFAKLYEELRYVMNLAIEKGGSTDKNYVNAEGKRGSYMDFARVFRQEGLPCPRCGTTIEKTKWAGRGTHVCPRCQVLTQEGYIGK
ncbi:MAG: bifunctional DNA-formamidopyrimidine glycosylase/DNA-(apurinic or apyrimidinic site) lyase [Candidatus Saccharimonadales bacterium]